MVAPVRGVQVVLGTIFEELHRSAQLLREPQDQRHVKVNEDSGTKPSTDVRCDDSDLLLGNAEHEGRYDKLMNVRSLRGCPEGVLLGARVVVADRAPRLHGCRYESLIEDTLAEPYLGLGQRAVDHLSICAARPMHNDIVRRVLMKLWRACPDRLARIDHYLQLVEVDSDCLEGVIRLVDAFRNDNRNRIAHLTHLA